jgi:regulator of sigma E protease
MTPPEIPTQKYSLFSAFERGLETTWLTCTSITRTLKQLIGGEVSPKHLSGPVGIATITNQMFERVGLTSVLFFIGFISINLAIVNLLPIPIADGGHLLFFAVEKIRGRPVPRKAQEIIQQVSVILIIALFLYITWFDSLRLFDNLRN